MICDRHEAQLIAVEGADGSVSIITFFTRKWNSKSPKAVIETPATDEAIERIIAKFATMERERDLGETAYTNHVGWWRIETSDLPTDEANRSAWRVSGRKIIVDASRIVEPEPTLQEQVADLKTRLTTVEAKVPKDAAIRG